MKLTRINILIMMSIIHCSSYAQKITKVNIIDKLNEKYKFTNDIKKYMVTYKFTAINPYQSHNYKHPEDKINGYGIYTIEIDRDEKEYFTHDRSQFPGNFVFEFKHFKNNKNAVSYDVNGVIRGKRLKQLKKDAFERQNKRAGEVLSFEKIADLLNGHKKGDDLKIKFDKNNALATITHTTNDNVINTYTFDIETLKLVTLKSTEDNSIVDYKNYIVKNGFEYAKVSVENFKKTMGISPSKFAIPYGYALPQSNQSISSEVNKIADNIYLINTNNNSRFILLKIIDNQIMVFGAPLSENVSEKIIDSIEKKFPMKTIKYVFVSHPHNDHIAGLVPYAKKGVAVIADDYTIEAIKNYPKFKETIKSFKFKTISNKERINGVRFYVLKNEHSLKQSFAYLEHEQIIYEGDFLEVPADNTIPTHISNVEKQFIEFVRSEKLNVKRIVQHHRNSNVTADVMNNYYNANAN
ncbi:Metallo-beta-lactamase superfamily protein [Tenacibaculum sp. MAR_2009_124]|uniref:MBL fold metallo-hydrolase n=1 Tax=Tenacibaculum sp. MAR_2009_124 TaxID=1250059 RepID=UPI000899EC6F|nr:MBL fold metallo-hydrolase [Tenacibaculum sp. MAR_2009_124]SEB38196.1 Metallo-beta-lactamase superfamily protein [Tenacibaculum sp. MAR_2009_124]